METCKDLDKQFTLVIKEWKVHQTSLLCVEGISYSYHSQAQTKISSKAHSQENVNQNWYLSSVSEEKRCLSRFNIQIRMNEIMKGTWSIDL